MARSTRAFFIYYLMNTSTSTYVCLSVNAEYRGARNGKKILLDAESRGLTTTNALHNNIIILYNIYEHLLFFFHYGTLSDLFENPKTIRYTYNIEIMFAKPE